MIRPHGGELINRVLSGNRADAIRKEYKEHKKSPRIVLDHDTLLDLDNIAAGVYSPLRGFMDAETFKSVILKKRLPGGLPWTIPVLLSLRKNDTKGLSRGLTVFLSDSKGAAVGVIKIKDIYSVDKDKVSRHIFGTADKRHPGVHKFYHTGDMCVGGEIWVVNEYEYPFYRFNLKPAQTRKLIADKGWRTAAGFQTRNVPHRAHEFLQKIGLSLVDGILIHPIIGWKKKGDFNPEMIIKSYKILIDHYYPKDRVIFSGLATAMRYAGPLEAVFHAIIRKNFGCTHFIVGRDHAGVGGFYDKYAAHRIFDRFPDLGIVPMLLNGPYYCRKCLSVVSDKICPHRDTHTIEISGTLIRDMISKNKRVPEEFLRKEVSEFIHRHRDRCFI
ncbi:MAG: sulfate adenylyltransferase [Candidatus Omnitrophica bacterium]|nr:sulfate adenylyltransferase [Candidatus Omnitrophota bacterium]